MKIVLLCGNQSNQAALANKVANQFDLAGVVLEKRKPKKLSRISFLELFNKVLDRTLFSGIRNVWFHLLEYYDRRFPSLPNVKQITVTQINSETTVDFIKEIQPDLLMVSGTSMVKEKILNLPVQKGILNLHTGLSPYIKGGPNCTNWCLATHQIHLIGNTVMWIDAGIDSGNIITTELTEFSGDENLLQIHIKVMEHAHDLYLRSLKVIENNFENCPNIKQASITEGKTYYTRMWGVKQKWKILSLFLTGRFRKEVLSEDYKRKRMKIMTVPLP